ncbi:hypothetical protein ACTU6U_02445 [Microbacterium sp. A196]|uniref:hypothetical protein n=1 Tax=unclassified Microbacterium TaxID=2609290 RepID=UPI003FD3335D
MTPIVAASSRNTSFEALTGFRIHTARGLEQLARRLRADGSVRSDFTVHDIILILTAVRAAAVVHGTKPETSTRRMLTQIFNV